MVNSRFFAALLHFGISLTIALAAFCVVYFIWYPDPLDLATGILKIFLILLGVDVILGPVLTCIVYKHGKKTLRFDLTVVAAMQLVALSYGLWVIAAGRPAWLVFNADRVDLVQAQELDSRFYADALPQYRKAPWMGPLWVASVNPENLEKRNNLILESVMGGPDLPQRIDLYRPIKTESANIREKSKPLVELLRYNTPDEVKKVQTKWPRADGWLPLMAKARAMVVLVDVERGVPLAAVDLRPWND